MSNLLTTPKKTIYEKLKEITSITIDSVETSVKVYQRRPDIIVADTDLIVVFSINNNLPKYGLDKDIKIQRIQTKIDIYGQTSTLTSKLLINVESKMREIDYLMKFSSDIGDPNNLSHITTIFEF